jgi:hypothetical protein
MQLWTLINKIEISFTHSYEKKKKLEKIEWENKLPIIIIVNY